MGVIGFYICFVTKPLQFYYYTWKHFSLWYNPVEVCFLMCFFPIQPVGIIIYESIIRPIKITLGLEIDWATLTGGVFFVKPKGFLAY